MTPFRIYKSKGFRYLAITPTLGLRVLKSGLSKSLYRLKSPTLINEADVKLVIDQPGKTQDDVFKTNIKLARQHWIDYGMTRNKNTRKLFYQAVLSCCSYFNKNELRQYNLRDVAKLIGIRSNRTFYHIMYLETRRQLQGRPKSISEAKDITLVRTVNHFRQLWPSIFGYSKRLDAVIKSELNLYVLAMKARSLRIDDSQPLSA